MRLLDKPAKRALALVAGIGAAAHLCGFVYYLVDHSLSRNPHLRWAELIMDELPRRPDAGELAAWYGFWTAVAAVVAILAHDHVVAGAARVGRWVREGRAAP